MASSTNTSARHTLSPSRSIFNANLRPCTALWSRDILCRLSYPVGHGTARLGASLQLQMGSLSEECARWYLAEIVVALEHMHAQGIVHRDLKPGSPLKLRSCCFPVVLLLCD